MKWTIFIPFNFPYQLTNYIWIQFNSSSIPYLKKPKQNHKSKKGKTYNVATHSQQGPLPSSWFHPHSASTGPARLQPSPSYLQPKPHKNQITPNSIKTHISINSRKQNRARDWWNQDPDSLLGGYCMVTLGLQDDLGETDGWDLGSDSDDGLPSVCDLLLLLLLSDESMENRIFGQLGSRCIWREKDADIAVGGSFSISIERFPLVWSPVSAGSNTSTYDMRVVWWPKSQVGPFGIGPHVHDWFWIMWL